MPKNIGQRIKDLRELTGLKPEAYAKLMGVSRPALLKWENGQTANLKLSNLLRICDYHSISLEDLIIGKKTDSQGNKIKVNMKDIAESWPFPITYKEFMSLDQKVRETICDNMESALMRKKGQLDKKTKKAV